jgi:polyhydroxyalkanoate synthase
MGSPDRKTANQPANATHAPPPAARQPSVPQTDADAHSLAPLDRAVMGNLARLTSGISPHAVIDAWSDWAMHLGRAPGRQLELAQRAQMNALRLARFAVESFQGATPEKPFVPDRADPRWRHPGWDRAPYAQLQQGFLGMQDWWRAATADLPGLRA